MTTTAMPVTAGAHASATSTLLTLARADARRFARHPLFVFGAGFLGVLVVAALFQRDTGPSPMTPTVLIAFFLGVFGFVVAHRLTTSLRRSGDLVGTLPVGDRQRTAALCLACLVPAAVASVIVAFMIIEGAIWPPEGIPASKPVAWFADEPDLAILAALIALGPVAALGGPLLGVAVARWAPFRGSALVTVVLLVFGTAMPSAAASPWRAIPPWAVLADEFVDENGKLSSSSLVPDVSPQWYLGYVLCLCGLAVVAALLRDPVSRRPLVWTGIGLTVAAIGCFALTVS
jgi:hypothetical protein